MKKENKRKSRKIVSIIGILIGLFLLLGVSYAVFKTKNIGEKRNKINTGTFNVEIKNETEIELNNEAPKREKKAKEEVPYTFTIENTGTIEARYDLYIETEEETTLSSEVIRYYLTKTNQEGKETIVTKTSQILEETKTKDNIYKIDIGRIKKEESYEYKLYIWVDIEASIEEASNKVFSGKIKLEAEQYPGNSNIVKALEYNEDKNATNYCITGEEETCTDNFCYLTKEKGSCKSGTIIIYKVTDEETKYFYVLHDDKEKMTLQQRENIFQVVWSKAEDEDGKLTNTKGPTEALQKLDELTNNWTNVENQTYTLGETVFLEGTNAYTGCSTTACAKNTYTMDSRSTKARLITAQEARSLGCEYWTSQSCPIYLYNYLNASTQNGGTQNDSASAYWSLSASSSYSNYAYVVNKNGRFNIPYNVQSGNVGIRSVIVIKK